MKKKILLVEYDSDTVDTIKGLLHNKIFAIKVAGDAAAAEALLKKEKFDMVIAEALLPKSHGFTVCQYVLRNFPDTRVVIIGEKIRETNGRREALRCGAAEYFDKPLDLLRFREKIDRMLDIHDKSEKTGENVEETTRIHVIPSLDELRAVKDKEENREKPEPDKFDDIIEGMRDDRDSYKIDLE